MHIDNFGKVILTEDEAFDSLYAGTISDLASVYLDNQSAIDSFNRSVKQNADAINFLPNYTAETDIEKFDATNRNNWFMPKEYLDFPMENWLIDQCKTEVEKTRVKEELELFVQHNAFDVLFYLKYLVDTMRENNIVWGVGRGSSVASYVLYLLGVHKIDSLKYNLDIREFLKKE